MRDGVTENEAIQITIDEDSGIPIWPVSYTHLEGDGNERWACFRETGIGRSGEAQGLPRGARREHDLSLIHISGALLVLAEGTHVADVGGTVLLVLAGAFVALVAARPAFGALAAAFAVTLAAGVLGTAFVARSVRALACVLRTVGALALIAGVLLALSLVAACGLSLIHI